MSEYVDFHYMPLEGKITGEQVLKQTEDAINDLGNKVYNLDIDQSEIDEAIEKSNEAINTANSALSAVTTGRSVWFNNVAEMVATDIEAGVTAETKGYYVANDGGNALYLIRQEKSGDVVDGGSLIALDNGNMAELVTNGTVNVKQFGAIGNGTDDDTTVFQNTSSYAQANGFVPFIGVATYKITSNITGTFNSFGEVTITGGGTVDIINLQEVVSDVSDIRDEVVGETASAKAYSESAATSATNASNSASSASTTATQLMAYLEDKETITAPAVDPTLTISGAAADAKVTGNYVIRQNNGLERIIQNDLNRKYENLLDIKAVELKKRINITTGNAEAISDQNTFASDYIPVTAGEIYQIGYSFYSSGDYGMAFYDSSKNYVSGMKQAIGSAVSDNSLPFEFVVPTGVSYVRFTANVTYNVFFKKFEYPIDIKTCIDGDYAPINANWEIGDIASGVDTLSHIKLRSSIIHATENMVLHVNTGWIYQIAYYTSNSVFMQQTLAITADTFIPADTYFRIVLSKDGYYRTRNDVINIMQYDKARTEDWYNNNFGKYNHSVMPFAVEKGILNTNGTNNDDSRYANGIRTPDYVTLDVPKVLKADSGYGFRVVFFLDDGTRSGTFNSSSSNNSLYIPAGFKFKISMYYGEYNYKSISEYFTHIYFDDGEPLLNGLFGSNFKLGYYSASDASFTKYAAMCVTDGYLQFDNIVKIKANDGWRFTVFVFDANDNYVWNSHTLEYDLAIPANTKFKVGIRESTLPGVENVINVLKNVFIEEITDTKPTFDWWMEIKGVAHGGYEQHAPFNTLPSFKMAIEAGLKYMETDLRFTSDGVPVLLHDATIDSMTDDASGAIADMTYAQVSQYDFGTKFDPSFAGTHICTLEELLKLCRDTQSFLYLEFKVTPSEEQFADVKDMIIEYLGMDKVTFLCVDYDLMRNVWTHFDNPRTAYIMTAAKVANLTTALLELNSFKINNNVVASVWIPQDNDWTDIKALFDAGFPIIAGTSHLDSVALTMPYFVSEFSGSVNYPAVLKEHALED